MIVPIIFKHPTSEDASMIVFLYENSYKIKDKDKIPKFCILIQFVYLYLYLHR